MELLKIPTVSYGTCYLIHCRNIDNWGEEEAVIYIGYVDSLKKEDIPKRLTIYFTAKNDWHGITLSTWREHQQPLKIDTSFHSFPLELEVIPLSQNHFYPYTPTESTKINQESCFNTEKIKELCLAENCMNSSCIPYIYSSLVNTSEIDICKR